ncbi:hypothetical protein AB0L40_26330 [Patulibacter sp. NPDC049589]|uniref:hypothetical protein n=1 Tax=Patulibacter sp. NPDC049589 TaxID=3154731 RepID=UPI0034223501
MSWLPLLLSVWIVLDVVIVGAIAHLARRRATLDAGDVRTLRIGPRGRTTAH